MERGWSPAARSSGLELTSKRDAALFVVAVASARAILESIRDSARFESKSGADIVFQLDIEDAVGLNARLPATHSLGGLSVRRIVEEARRY